MTSDLVEHGADVRSGAAGTSLVIACGAIAREVLAVVELNSWGHVDVACLPAKLHMTPKQIAPALDAMLRERAGSYQHVFVAYADCGTTGEIDSVLERYGVDRLPGEHCYGFLAGNARWEELHEEEPGSFYLTDFLARHFEALVIKGLGIDRCPELATTIFANYRRLVYLAQTDDPALLDAAARAADRLGLALVVERTGYGELQPSLEGFVAQAGA